MRCVSSATCASGDPVSVSCTPYSARVVFFCSVVSATGLVLLSAVVGAVRSAAPTTTEIAAAGDARSRGTDEAAPPAVQPPRTAAGRVITQCTDDPGPRGTGLGGTPASPLRGPAQQPGQRREPAVEGVGGAGQLVGPGDGAQDVVRVGRRGRCGRLRVADLGEQAGDSGLPVARVA